MALAHRRDVSAGHRKESRVPAWRAHGAFDLMLAVLCLAACTTGVSSPSAAAPSSVARSDDLLVVDCLLPPQIRQLGQRLTYATAPRPVKTSARDCQLRGGEYVSYDRANYATALKIWLPKAKEGDVDAQTYVGEIFEKGLGLPADYAAAAEWYRRAATAGSARAAVNLGALYEQGLGVPRDPAQAVQLYRRAAGVTEVRFDVPAPPGPPPVSAETQRLRQEVSELRRQLEGKQGELERTQRELEGLRRGAEQRRTDVEAERAALARLRQELNARRTSDQGGSARVRELERTVAEREGRLATKDRELTEARATLAKQEAALKAQIAAVDQLQKQAAQTGPPPVSAETQRLRQEVSELRRQLEGKQGELERTQRELEGLRRGAEQRRTDVEAERAALARLRQELNARRTSDQAGSARLQELERTVAEREGRLATKDRELTEARATLAKQEAVLKAQTAAVEQMQKQAAEAGPEIYIIEPQLLVSRDIQPMRAVATSEHLMVVGRVTAPGGIFSVTVNGREEKLENGSVFKARIPVRNAEERVRIVAVDRSGRRATLEFVVAGRSEVAAAVSGRPAASEARIGFRPPREPLRLGSYHALVIGNNNYTHREMTKLKTAVNDAREVARVLEKEYGFRVTLLIDANRYAMLNALNDLRQRLTEKDNLLIYYAGHGTLDQKNQRGHWLPVDAEPNSPTNWISNVAVSDMLNAMTVQQLLVVADSCYSGTLTRSALGQLEGGMSEDARLRVIRVMAQRRSRMVMTSGGLEPVLDGTGPHSVFAVLFIELLRANVGVLPGYEMFQLLRARVTASAAQQEVRQVPEYAPIKFAGHESGDFVFVRAN
jgi:hypothetical protein